MRDLRSPSSLRVAPRGHYPSPALSEAPELGEGAESKGATRAQAEERPVHYPLLALRSSSGAQSEGGNYRDKGLVRIASWTYTIFSV